VLALSGALQQPGGRWIKQLFWSVVIVSLIPVPFFLLYSPGIPGYTLTPDALSIHDRFFPVTLAADAIDVSGLSAGNFRQLRVLALLDSGDSFLAGRRTRKSLRGFGGPGEIRTHDLFHAI